MTDIPLTAIDGPDMLRELEALRAENRELRAAQAAGSGILQMMSASLDDAQPAFVLIARHARELCGAAGVALTEYDGNLLHLRVIDGAGAAESDALRHSYPRPPATDFIAGRAVLSGGLCHFHDVTTEPDLARFAREMGFRSAIGVPLRRGGQTIGALVLSRVPAGGFNEGEIALIRSFADQAVIALSGAATLAELRARTAELASRNSEYGERIEQQSATIDVLKVMSASPGDATPVFELIVESARSFCEADVASLALAVDGAVHVQAQCGLSGEHAATYTASFPRPIGADTVFGRTILARDVQQVADNSSDPSFAMAQAARAFGIRSHAGVPLLRGSEAIGALVIARKVPGDCTTAQMELLRTFAEQAVIAIGSADTYRALQAHTAALAERNAAYREQITHQSATIDVLKAMSASPGDAQPVFDLIVQRAAAVCNAPNAVLFRYDGELAHWQATTGAETYASPEAFEAIKQRFPMAPNRASLVGRCILDRTLVHIRDVETEPEIYQALRDLNTRSLLSVPLLRDGVVLGVLGLSAREPGGFTDSQVALLETFAEQAVIAMVSAGTFQELQERTAELARRNNEYGERIAHQSATIDVLKAMSASPGDTQPVFDLIVRHALHACNGMSCGLFGYDGKLVHTRVTFGGDAAAVSAYQATFPRPPARDFLAGRAILDQQTIHVRDIDNEPDVLPAVRAMGGRTTISMPLLRDGAAIGAISLNAREPGGFSDSQIELLRTFAEQAVIAIASAETYRALQERTAALALRNNEYGERIEQQSATIDVLKVMSSSPGDAQPVFELIARRALEFCGATGARLVEFDGELQHLRALARADEMETEADAAIRALYPVPPDAGSIAGRVILDGSIVHARDPSEVPPAMRGRYQGSVVGVPLLREGRVAGAIMLSRAEPGGFSDTQVELLQTFAEQAVIAIGGAETFRALQERTEALARRNSEYSEQIEHQSATIDVLKAMSASPGDAQPVFDLITRHAAEVCNAPNAVLFLYDGALMHWVATSGEEAFASPAAFEALRQTFPKPPTRDSSIGRSILDRKIHHVRDIDADPELNQMLRAINMKSLVGVPLLRDGEPVGVIGLSAREVGGFSDSQVALLSTFAEQAVIAIISAETFQELRARTEALARRNSEYGERIEHQAATIDVLKAMSASSGDTQPVFDLIVQHAAELCDAQMASLALFDGEMMELAAHSGLDAEGAISYAAQFPRPAGTDSTLGRAIVNRAAVQIEDLAADPLYVMPRRRNASRSTMAQPLLRDAKPVGAILIGRQQPGRFSDSQIALLQTFAEQAVIAIISAETFRALQHRTSELSRSVAELQALEEVLRAVNSSLELNTVLATIISRSVQLSQADEGTIYEFDQAEQVFVPRSAFGMSSERVALLRERRIRFGETHLGRSAVLRAPVSVDDVQTDPSVPNAAEALPGIHAVLAVPLLHDDQVVGGLVIRRRAEEGFAPTLVTLMQTFAGQAVLAIENARLFQEARQARTAAEAALADLRSAQDRLVQAEKMASLGQLTAGVAHEIKNPLNFVNNFSDLSRDLLDELRDAVAANQVSEIAELTATLKGNLEKIAQHGRRADSIVRNMLLHSRSGPSEHRAVELNAVVEEALNLAYHGARAETPGFNITLNRAFDPGAGMIELYPQEFTRVMVNLINNAFYAARRRTGEQGFEPTLWVSTRNNGPEVEIRVRDNGTGISPAVRQRIFEPFFTTKPTGEGTGLGLSLSYDIIVKQHGGRLTVDSAISDFTEFLITLPRIMAENDGGQA